MLCALLLATLSIPGGLPGWPASGGPGEDLHLIGNGGLTVALDQGGQVVHAYWPAPGFFNQVPTSGEAPPAPWSLTLADGTTRTLTDCQAHTRRASAAAPIVETRYACDDLEAAQMAFVHPELDVLVVRMELRGLESVPGIHWHPGFRPEGTRVPHAFVPAAFFEGRAEILSEVDGDTHYWHAAGKDRDDLATDHGGTWIGVRAGSGTTASELGPREAGPGLPAVALRPAITGDAWIAEVYLAFASSRDGAGEALEQAVATGFPGLLQETERHWERRLTALPHFNAGRYAQALQVLLLLQHRETGILMAAPETGLRFGNAQLAAWTSAALAATGLTAEAMGQLLALGAGIASNDEGALPAGAVAPLFFTDGTPAAPRTIVQVQATAWWLAALSRTLLALEEPAFAAFVEELWGPVDRAAAFLSGWSYGPRGDVAPSYDPVLRHDSVNMNQRLQVFLGLESALAVYRMAGEGPPPGLVDRARELDILLRFHILNQEHPWHVEAGLAFWFEALLDAAHPIWGSRVRVGQFEGPLREMPLPTTENPEVSSAYRAAIHLLSDDG